jgi:hypothetical protein
MGMLLPQYNTNRLLTAVAQSSAERLAFIPLPGELVFDLVLGDLFVGDGQTYGGCPVDPIGIAVGAIPFKVQGSIASTTAVTPVVLLADALLPPTKKIYIDSWFVTVGGATAWSGGTGTIVTIGDNTPTAAITIAVAQLTANAVFGPGVGTQTLAALMTTQAGLGAGKGLRVYGDNNFGAGSALQVTVSGVIK